MLGLVVGSARPDMRCGIAIVDRWKSVLVASVPLLALACALPSVDVLDAPPDAGVDSNSGDSGASGASDAGDSGSDEHGPGVQVPQGNCIAGDTQCAPSGVQLCNRDGKWALSMSCDNACVDGACTGQCRPGHLRCDDNQRQMCRDSGTWHDIGEPCEHVCSGGACSGACSPDDSQCVSATHVQECGSQGQWNAATQCPFACVSVACGGECVPGERQCMPQTPSTAFRVCTSSGTWSASPATCSYVCTGDGECGGQCSPGARGCAENTPTACTDDGTWQTESACSGTTPVCVAGQCRCRRGSRRCRDTTQPQVCNAASQWVDVGAACASCTEGRCPGEGCSEEQRNTCASTYGCECASGTCGGAYCEGDGCTGARRTACAALGCGCVDGACSGGFCDGTGCTVRKTLNCEAFTCNCALSHCVGGACDMSSRASEAAPP